MGVDFVLLCGLFRGVLLCWCVVFVRVVGCV